MPDNRSICGNCGSVYGEEWCMECLCLPPPPFDANKLECFIHKHTGLEFAGPWKNGQIGFQCTDKKNITLLCQKVKQKKKEKN